MSIDTMDRSRAGGLRAVAISVLTALGLAWTAPAEAQGFETPSNRLALTCPHSMYQLLC